jgi:ferredoxin
LREAGLHQIQFLDTGEMLNCGESASLLQSMERLGRKGIPVGCRNGGCGVCKIQVLDGQFDRRVMSRAHVSAEEQEEGFALACRITPRSDLAIKVIGKMKRAFAV